MLEEYGVRLETGYNRLR